jgi:hypothetical protein
MEGDAYLTNLGLEWESRAIINPPLARVTHCDDVLRRHSWTVI